MGLLKLMLPCNTKLMFVLCSPPAKINSTVRDGKNDPTRMMCHAVVDIQKVR